MIITTALYVSIIRGQYDCLLKHDRTEFAAIISDASTRSYGDNLGLYDLTASLRASGSAAPGQPPSLPSGPPASDIDQPSPNPGVSPVPDPTPPKNPGGGGIAPPNPNSPPPGSVVIQSSTLSSVKSYVCSFDWVSPIQDLDYMLILAKQMKLDEYVVILRAMQRASQYAAKKCGQMGEREAVSFVRVRDRLMDMGLLSQTDAGRLAFAGALRPTSLYGFATSFPTLSAIEVALADAAGGTTTADWDVEDLDPVGAQINGSGPLPNLPGLGGLPGFNPLGGTKPGGSAVPWTPIPVADDPNAGDPSSAQDHRYHGDANNALDVSNINCYEYDPNSPLYDACFDPSMPEHSSAVAVSNSDAPVTYDPTHPNYRPEYDPAMGKQYAGDQGGDVNDVPVYDLPQDPSTMEDGDQSYLDGLIQEGSAAAASAGSGWFD